MVAFFAIATSVLLVLPSVFAEPMSIPHGLYPRQLTGFDPSKIPTSCLQDKCKALSDAVSTGNCATLDCLCTSAIANGLKTCLQCAVDANIAGYSQSTLDDAINGFTQACSSAGHPISGVTSGSGSGSGSSAAASASATGAATTKGSGAIAQTTISIMGAIFAVALGGVALA